MFFSPGRSTQGCELVDESKIGNQFSGRLRDVESGVSPKRITVDLSVHMAGVGLARRISRSHHKGRWMINPQAVRIFVKQALTKCPPCGQPKPGRVEADVPYVLLYRGACEYPSGAQPCPLLRAHHELPLWAIPLRAGESSGFHLWAGEGAAPAELERRGSRAEEELLGLRRGREGVKLPLSLILSGLGR